MNWKLYVLLGTFLLGVGFYAGYSTRKVEKTVQVVTIEKEVVVEKEAEEIVVTKWRDRVVTVERIVRPDGTIEERTIESEREVAEEWQRREREIAKLREELTAAQTHQVITPVLPKYSAGLQLPLKFLTDPTNDIYSVAHLTVGFRPLEFPVWVEGGFQPASREMSVGLRYEF